MNKFALLSIVPGLGQLYLGDKRKGVLFLEVALVNYVLLLIACFSHAIAESIRTIGEQYSFKPNYEMVSALEAMHMGSPTSLLLIGAMLVFWRYATCDAAQKARGKKRTQIYRDRAIEFSEATSGSYVGHVALMISCMLLAIMFVHPPKRAAQIVDIQFMEEQTVPRSYVTPRTKLTSTKDVESHSRRRMHDTPRVAHQSSTAPSTVHEVTPPKPVAPAATPSSSSATAAPPAPASKVASSAPAPTPLPRTASAPAPAPLPRTASAPAPTPLPRTTTAPTPLAVAHVNPMPRASQIPAPTAPSPAGKPAAAQPMMPMAPTSSLHAVALTAPTLPTVSSATNSMPVAPKALSGVSTTGTSRFAPVPGGSFRATSTSGTAPTIIAMHSTTSGGAPNVVALAPHTAAGLFPAGGPGEAGVLPIKASPNSSGTTGSMLSVAPAVPRSSGSGPARTAGDSHPSTAVSDGAPGRDSVATKAGTPDFSAYMAELQRRIKKNWFPPKDGESRKITVQFKVALDGAMSDLRVTRSSGLGLCDQAAVSAIEHAAPFRALPKDAQDSVDIEFTFDYNVFTGRDGQNIRTW